LRIKHTLEMQMRISLDRCGTFRIVVVCLGAVSGVLFLLAGQVQAGGTLYLIDDGSLFRVDVNTADADRIGPAAGDALAPSEVRSALFCAHGAPDLYRLPVDGTAEIFLATIGGDNVHGLAFNTRTGVLYATGYSFFGTVDQVTGEFTPLATPSTRVDSLAADPDSDVVYALAIGDNPNLMAYDVSTNVWGVVGSTTVSEGRQTGLAFDPVAEILYASAYSEPGGLYSIDPTTAATTWVGNLDLGGSSGDFFGLAFVSDRIFRDGFESGDTTFWSGSTP
jgi:hypothetical protein